MLSVQPLTTLHQSKLFICEVWIPFFFFLFFLSSPFSLLLTHKGTPSYANAVSSLEALCKLVGRLPEIQVFFHWQDLVIFRLSVHSSQSFKMQAVLTFAPVYYFFLIHSSRNLSWNASKIIIYLLFFLCLFWKLLIWSVSYTLVCCAS